MRYVIVLALLTASCAPDSKQAENPNAKRYIERAGPDIEILESGGNCIYTYNGYGVAAVNKPLNGC